MKKILLTGVLSVGLLFPAVTASASANINANANAEHNYTVESGDTMWKVALKYDVSVPALIHANPEISNPDIIYIGDSLVIPAEDNHSEKENTESKPNNDSDVSEDKEVEKEDAVESDSLFVQEVIDLTNNEREKAGLQPVKYDAELSQVALLKSQDMQQQGYFAHDSPTYGSLGDLLQSQGIRYMSAGENIAQGYTTPESVVEGWMNSAGHRANILNDSFTHIGIGYVEDGHYWTQQFIGK